MGAETAGLPQGCEQLSVTKLSPLLQVHACLMGTCTAAEDSVGSRGLQQQFVTTLSALLQVYARLVGSHKGAVTAMVTLGSKEPGGADLLVTAASDGTISVWDPSAAAPRGAEKEVAALSTFRAHESAVLAMTLFQVMDSGPDAPALQLSTAGQQLGWPSWLHRLVDRLPNVLSCLRYAGWLNTAMEYISSALEAHCCTALLSSSVLTWLDCPSNVNAACDDDCQLSICLVTQMRPQRCCRGGQKDGSVGHSDLEGGPRQASQATAEGCSDQLGLQRAGWSRQRRGALSVVCLRRAACGLGHVSTFSGPIASGPVLTASK